MSNIQDDEDRGIMIFAWWMAVLADGYSAAYFRKKPMLSVVPSSKKKKKLHRLNRFLTGTMTITILISIRLLQSPFRTHQMTPRGSRRIGNILKCVINTCQRKPVIPDIHLVSSWYNVYPLIFHTTSETFPGILPGQSCSFTNRPTDLEAILETGN